MSVNKVIILGRVGKDPEIRSMQSGSEIANLTVATSERWKDKNTGEQKEKTEWTNVVVFSSGLVNVIKKYVKKGSQIYVEGQLQTRKWQDKEGKDRYSTEVVLQGFNASLVLLGGKNEAQEKRTQAKGNAYVEPEYGVDELSDEIPF